MPGWLIVILIMKLENTGELLNVKSLIYYIKRERIKHLRKYRTIKTINITSIYILRPFLVLELKNNKKEIKDEIELFSWASYNSF